MKHYEKHGDDILSKVKKRIEESFETANKDQKKQLLLLYPSLDALKETYCRYFKNQLQNDREIILFLSTYQNINSVRDTLRDVDVDVAKFERA